MNREILSEVLVSILLREGPQDFRRLQLILQSDSEYGYLAFQTPGFEQEMRECLKFYSQKHSPKFIMSFGYKWIAVQSSAYISELNLKVNQDSPWIELGAGEESVYGIFSLKLMSEGRRHGNSWYPIKIGRTSRNVSNRLRELQTGSYLDLQLGIQVRTSDCVELEKEIHDQLKHRKLCADSTQREWFFSSIEEIRAICCELDSNGRMGIYQQAS
jgi:hypothetical protein